MATNLTSSLQEAAARYANTILASLNASAAEMLGVDVMWFRATPDKRSQDVIFQSYTLYGVEDCPLSFRAVYTDTGYDEGAITYNIMGLNFNIPMTLDIALETWKKATENDGTIPQEKDIVFVPITRKLLQVASMTPVKSVGGQLTGYKVNLEIYKPMRSRIVGENLKDSIKENTTNLDERFGKEIDETLKDIVDDKQISKYTSTSEDIHKEVSKDINPETGKQEVSVIESYELIVDGHTVARNYYNMKTYGEVVVKYKTGDKFTKSDERCLSAWFRSKDNSNKTIKNVKSSNTELEVVDGKCYILTTTGKNFKKGEEVIMSRGLISVPGVVVSSGRILINSELAKEFSKLNPRWYKLPGFTLSHCNTINLISGEDFSIRVLGLNMVSISAGENEKLIRLDKPMDAGKWYGIIINFGETFSVDVFKSETGLERIENIEDIENKIYDSIEIKNYRLISSDADITNIRLYNTFNKNIDKEILDLVSYNARNDSHAIINDSADTYLNKPYMGKQR